MDCGADRGAGEIDLAASGRDEHGGDAVPSSCRSRTDPITQTISLRRISNEILPSTRWSPKARSMLRKAMSGAEVMRSAPPPPGVQRTIHRLVHQGALDRMEARIYADPSLMTIRRCTVEHPFGTTKRMSGGGRFLTRGLRAVKAEAALSVLASTSSCRERLWHYGD
jgi:hypothetical protein